MEVYCGYRTPAAASAWWGWGWRKVSAYFFGQPSRASETGSAKKGAVAGHRARPIALARDVWVKDRYVHTWARDRVVIGVDACAGAGVDATALG